MRTRANILSDKINEKMDELKFKVRTLDGGSCLSHMPIGEENSRMKEMMRKRNAMHSQSKRSSQTSMVESKKDISDMTPY